MRAVNINHLYKSYNGKPAVEDLTFSVNSGELLGLIGPNGTGKSTTIKIFLSGNLLQDKISPEVLNLVVSPLNLEVTRVTAQGEQALEQKSYINVVIPAVFSLLLSLGEEKESRLIEVLFSPVSLRQLLIGKLLALGLAGLLQVLVWLISAPLLLLLALTLFRATAPVQYMLRLGVTDIPLWQILVSIGLLILSIALGLYFSVRIFRI